MNINWSTIDHRSLLGKLLRLPLRALPKQMVVKIRRGPCKGMKWIVGSSNHGCWLGTYELDKQLALQRFVKRGMVVYDIGAQAGFYSLCFSHLVGEGKVYAFEPFAENVRHLLSHIRMNTCRNVKVVQIALADRAGLADFTVDRGKLQNRLEETADATLRVPVLSIDEMVGDHLITPPDLIKMDIEGAEFMVLQGAAHTIEHYRPILFIALHGREQMCSCRSFLDANGYTIYSLDGTPSWESPGNDEIYALPHRDKMASKKTT